ncbi:Gfo/Idh/MocA family protein [Desulfohalobium retbaense]|uniref:Oxidoreductase domain protein n=1 Tax=Desulfohalobium retbaense (strain ATCC 49708 / DSM 5692 / JCM 16813 / HR100) TaxID=485915 RepID=C8WYZ4_DESRD|nr:Gfo/Idh/MocA family oxidoreductase [Desulfohalobium retbaense]ACV67910.1 oxidoreductase domain protein [Desulfohalobium retbaense DSM 5692]
MARPQLKLGLVGLGTWAGKGHLPVYLGSRLKPFVQVSALCSRSLDKARQWCAEYGIQNAYADYSEMLRKERLDVVAVCTPDSLHTDYVLMALDAGAHVIVEKPLATSTDKCSRIWEKAQKTGRKVITLYHKRADPLWIEARQIARPGAYGPLQMGWAEISNPVTVPTGSYFTSDMTALTDANWFLGTHFYDLLRYITGLNPSSVYARKYYGKLRDLGYNVPDAIKADMIFENNASLSFLLAWNLPQNVPALTKQRMTLHFQEGELELDGMRRGMSNFGPQGYFYANPYFLQETPAGLSGYGASFLEDSLIYLYDPEHSPKAALPSLEDAWWATAMAEAVQESARSEATATISRPPSSIRP